ncbi:MAG: germination protein YpeB, partial [Clostridia bacterium]|nr:germination protein YpeB [Clostridia bacterium]
MEKRKLYWLFSVVIVALGVFGTYEFYNARAYRQSLEDTYNRAFFELADYVDDIDTLLAKGMLVTSAGEMANISSELSVQASAAKACLAQIPTTQVQLDKTEKFLSQVGDYTHTLSQSLIDKKAITQKEYESLASLGEYAQGLNQSLGELSNRIYSGDYRLGDDNDISLEKVAYAETSDPWSAIEKDFGEYPSLIYDGPFSEHIENMQPKMTESARELSKDEAQAKAAKFFGIPTDKVEYSGETQNSVMDSYGFKCNIDGHEVMISLTKKGGYPVYFLKNRRVNKENVPVEEAIYKARQFLKEKGFTDMKNSYYEKSNGVATVNFAYKQNDVICYSDLIKVKVALDDGEIVGMEAKGYVMNHHSRDIRTPRLTKQEARGYVSSHLSIDSTNLA